jgi:hypothetical protein
MADHESAGRYRDQQGANFRLGQFHDELIKNGSLPLSVVEWILLDDRRRWNRRCVANRRRIFGAPQ